MMLVTSVMVISLRCVTFVIITSFSCKMLSTKTNFTRDSIRYYGSGNVLLMRPTVRYLMIISPVN